MDTHTTRATASAPRTNDSASRRRRRFAVIPLVAGITASGVSAHAQSGLTPVPRRIPSRHESVCGGDRLDGQCEDTCSGEPRSPRYDADCFSCAQFASPEPKRACRTPNEPCEIHEGISRLGALVESGAYDDSVMRAVVLAYWDGAAWGLTANWGASSLDGYVVYAAVRTALEFQLEIERHPTTRMAMECMLRDHAERGLPSAKNNGERWFHGASSDWNSWSEDYMGFALGYAAADAWFASTAHTGEYFDEYYDKVGEAVTLAFSVSKSDGSPPTLVRQLDPDPVAAASRPSVMMRNHDEYSPVYATAILKHVADVNNVYRAAGLPPRYTCSNKPATFDELYRWVVGKIGPNPSGAGYVFRSDGCQRRDGVLSYCDDRPGDPAGSTGVQREPGHYPMAEYLVDLCVADHLEYFSASCDRLGPAGLEQQPYNYVFNCVFTGGTTASS